MECTIIINFFSGVLLIYLPVPMSNVGLSLKLETEDAVFVFIMAYTIYTLIQLRFISVFNSRAIDWKVLKCICLLELAALAFSMSLCNFSLAFFITSLYVPVALIMSPSNKRLVTLSKMFLCILIHPLTILFAVCSLDSMAYNNFTDHGMS